MDRVYINDDFVIVNNRHENLFIVYNRFERIEYNINKETYLIIKKIKYKKYTLLKLQEEFGEKITKDLLNFKIIVLEKQKNISNLKELKKYNNARIFAEITNMCNLKCKHCYGAFGINNKSEIDIELLKKLIDNAAANGVYQFDLTGGEPFLYSKIEELLKYLYESGMLVRIFSNLTIFNTRIKNLILKYGVKSIVTSLDSCKKEIHDDFRGNLGCFEKTLKNIKKLKYYGIEVTVNTMIGDHNKDHLDELVEFIKKLRVKSVMDVIISEGRAKAIENDIHSSALLIKGIYEKNFNLVNLNATSINCGIGERFIYIKSDGNIYICPNLIFDSYKLGNIKDFDTIKYWNKMHSSFGNLHCDKKQKKCVNCKGGCRARALSLNDDISGCDDVYCIVNGVDYK